MREGGNLLVLLGFILIDCAYLIIKVGFGKDKFDEPRQLKLDKLELKITLYVLVIIKLITTIIIVNIKGSLLGIFSLQPEDTHSISFLYSVFDFLFPTYLALNTFTRFQKETPFYDKRVLFDFLIMVGISFLSHSKAAVLIYVYSYLVAMLLLSGSGFLKKVINVRGILIFLVMILVIGIKTQLRSKASKVDTSTLVTQFVGGTSARFLGGVHRTYLYSVDKILKNEKLEFQGAYLSQILYLWVPRVLWPGKPNVQSERLYYLLNIENEEYGTSFAINLFGCMILDFGITGLFFQSVLFGLVLAFLDYYIRYKRVLNFKNIYLILILFNSLLLLVEAGIPMAMISIVIQIILFLFILLLKNLILKLTV